MSTSIASAVSVPHRVGPTLDRVELPVTPFIEVSVERIEARLREVNCFPGWCWEDGLLSGVLEAAKRARPIEVKPTMVLRIKPRAFRAPYGAHERVSSLFTCAQRAGLLPIHPLLALATLVHIRKERPDLNWCVLNFGMVGLMYPGRGSYILQAHFKHTGDCAYLSPVYSEPAGGSTMYDDPWLFVPK